MKDETALVEEECGGTVTLLGHPKPAAEAFTPALTSIAAHSLTPPSTESRS